MAHHPGSHVYTHRLWILKSHLIYKGFGLELTAQNGVQQRGFCEYGNELSGVIRAGDLSIGGLTVNCYRNSLFCVFGKVDTSSNGDCTVRPTE